MPESVCLPFSSEGYFLQRLVPHRISYKIAMKLLVATVLACLAGAFSQHLGHHYSDHGGHDHLESSHALQKHGHHAANDQYGDEGYAKHGHHELASHKAHGAKAAHHGAHDAHHDKGFFERNKGSGYEKAYAYDHIKSSHDKGSTHSSHGYEHANHGSEGLHKVADDSSHGYNKHGHKSSHGGHGYSDVSKTLKKSDGYQRSYDNRAHHPAPIPVVIKHGYEPAYKVPVAYKAPVAYSAPVEYKAPVAYSAPAEYKAPHSYGAPVYAGPEDHDAYLH